jgi:hypothetical protein
MNNLGLDHRAQLDLARQHAAELRDSWKSANGPSLGRGDESVDPCSESRQLTLSQLVGRFMASVRRQLRRVAAEPCSDSITA